MVHYAVLILALTSVLVACAESVDVESLVEEAVTATELLEDIEKDRDLALDAFTDAWEQVEGGPQFTLLALESAADRLESQGQTIKAAKMRDEANAEFDAHPLVQDAYLKADRYNAFDALALETNRLLGATLIELNNADGLDLYRERMVATEAAE